MEEKLEISIRRKYSELYPKLEALALWVSNTLSELCLHDRHLYNYKLRIKTIDSLLGKVDDRIAKGESINTCEEVFEHINDIVGARIILFYPSKFMPLHAALMGFRRAKTTKVTLHYQIGFVGPTIQRIMDDVEARSIELEKSENKTGYTGVHYVFLPNPVDEYYGETECMFNKFELQVRTILQEAWSEVQHAVIYKGKHQPDFEAALTLGQFSTLAQMLNDSDNLLDRLAHPVALARTYELQTDERPKQFDPALKDIEDAIREFEAQEWLWPEEERYKRAREVLQRHNKQIARCSVPVTKENVVFNLSLAELYLKGGQYNEAYELYVEVLKITEKDGWVLLRLAETCDSLAKEQQAVENIAALEKHLRKRKRRAHKDDILYAFGAVLAWKYKLIETAIFLGEKAVELTPSDNPSKLVHRKLNLLYYHIDSCIEKHGARVKPLKSCICKLRTQAQDVENGMEELSEESVTASDWHSLAWYYYQLANAEYGLEDKGACKTIMHAKELMDKCFAQWANHERDREDRHEIWMALSKLIKDLLKLIQGKWPDVFL